jgi:PBP1b-binding outer membrane lipoprotein LpoB
MRLALALLIALSCTGCAYFQKPAAQAPAPQQAAVAVDPPPVADVPAKFECSDGTISISQDACLVAMARARLPPGQAR